MKRREVIASAAAIALLSGCGSANSKKKLRYRLKAYVHIEHHEYVGSTVLETVWSNAGIWGGWGGAPQWHARTFGDAITIDLGAQGLLFGLLGEIIPYRGHRFDISITKRPDIFPEQRSDFAENLDHIAGLKGEFTISGQEMPVFVRFHDITNPDTVEFVDDFAAVYGAGSSLDRVTVSITSDPMTRGIEKRFPWWDAFVRHSRKFKSGPLRPYDGLSPKSFVAEKL